MWMDEWIDGWDGGYWTTYDGWHTKSLLKPDKYAARRSHKENQAISTITTERDSNNQQNSAGSIRGKSGGGGGGSGGGGTGGGGSGGAMPSANNQHSPHGMPRNYYDRDQRHTQVKTYTDQGNGFNQRSGSTTLYSKVGKLCILNKSTKKQKQQQLLL